MSDVVIRIENLGKRYRYGGVPAVSDSLRADIAEWVKGVVRLGRNGHRRFRDIHEQHLDKDPRYFWALKDINLEIKQGEVVGIIGRNGAGKSTLLKILSRITPPTTGKITYRGRIASLLEVGTGFHRELTGRENIYLNGSILGMTRREITRKLDEIVAFAEIEKFLDTPVKFYSSGMYVRLAFAVAAHLDPEILIVDEVLAVGDANFQKKCLGKMGEVSKGGRTVLFVSHNMAAIEALCRRAIWIQNGQIKRVGDSVTTIGEYLKSIQNQSEREAHLRAADNSVELLNIRLCDPEGHSKTVFRPREGLKVELVFAVNRRVEGYYLWIGISSRWGSLFGANMLLDGTRVDLDPGRHTIGCLFSSLPLLPNQTYTIRIGMRSADGQTHVLESTDVAQFSVAGDVRAIGLHGDLAAQLVGHSAPVLVPYCWYLPNGKVASFSP